MATPEELAALSLTAGDANQLELLQTSLASQSTTNPETTNRVMALYERELENEKYGERLRGFPTCPQCSDGRSHERTMHLEPNERLYCLGLLRSYSLLGISAIFKARR